MPAPRDVSDLSVRYRRSYVSLSLSLRKPEKRTLEYPDGGREVVDAPGGSEGSDDDAGGGHEIVGESVVEVTLQLEDVLDVLELLLVSARKKKGQVSKGSYPVDIISIPIIPNLHRFFLRIP